MATLRIGYLSLLAVFFYFFFSSKFIKFFFDESDLRTGFIDLAARAASGDSRLGKVKKLVFSTLCFVD